MKYKLIHSKGKILFVENSCQTTVDQSEKWEKQVDRQLKSNLVGARDHRRQISTAQTSCDLGSTTNLKIGWFPFDNKRRQRSKRARANLKNRLIFWRNFFSPVSANFADLLERGMLWNETLFVLYYNNKNRTSWRARHRIKKRGDHAETKNIKRKKFAWSGFVFVLSSQLFPFLAAVEAAPFNDYNLDNHSSLSPSPSFLVIPFFQLPSTTPLNHFCLCAVVMWLLAEFLIARSLRRRDERSLGGGWGEKKR